jgi:hypothetical protein
VLERGTPEPWRSHAEVVRRPGHRRPGSLKSLEDLHYSDDLSQTTPPPSSLSGGQPARAFLRGADAPGSGRGAQDRPLQRPRMGTEKRFVFTELMAPVMHGRRREPEGDGLIRSSGRKEMGDGSATALCQPHVLLRNSLPHVLALVCLARDSGRRALSLSARGVSSPFDTRVGNVGRRCRAAIESARAGPRAAGGRVDPGGSGIIPLVLVAVTGDAVSSASSPALRPRPRVPTTTIS